MKYLFFDCEFASCKGGAKKICEFGYVIVDETFKVLYKGNFIINPNIDNSEWDSWALKNILTRKKEVYENKFTFPVFYDRIVAILKYANYILGHTISADVHALNCEFKRYNLASVDFTFYDIKEMYKAYNATKKSVSVEKMLEELGIHGESNLHDAESDAYNTMLELKAILEKLEMKVEDLIELCPGARDKTVNGSLESKEKALEKRIERRERLLDGDYSDGSNDMLSLRRKSNKKTFLQFLDNVQVTEKGSNKLKDKKISISINYECQHFKEMMNLVQIIKNEGGEYVLKGSESDIFVYYHSLRKDGTPRNCNREKYVDLAISEGKLIQKISLDEFLSLLGLTNKQLESMPLPSVECLFRKDAIIKDKKTRS